MPRRIPLPPKPPGHFIFPKGLHNVYSSGVLPRCESSKVPYNGCVLNPTFRRGANPSLGLTLSEIVVAFGILAFVALTIIGVFLALLQTSAKNREQAVAELLVESLLERAAAAGPTNSLGQSDWGVGGLTGVRHEADLAHDGVKFFYQVDPREISSGPVPNVDGRSYEVTVTVGWWVDESSGSMQTAREGFGNLFVKGTRTVYVRPGDRV